MGKFAFMVHPLNVADVSRKFPIAKRLPDRLVEKMIQYMPPVKTSYISGIKSAYAETEGWFVGCPLTTRQMLTLPEDFVLKRIIQTGKLAEKLGAQILGLGAMTSVVGDAGITVAKHLNIAVTTGNSYTVATAIEGTKKAAELMDIDFPNANVVVIGATGSIGSVCARLLAKEVRYLTLVARNKHKLERVASRILQEEGLAVKITQDISRALRDADVIVTVTSAVDTIIEPEHLKPGAVVCDVARPRDVSKKVAEMRDDVLVIEGGVVEVPGEVQFNFNFGYPPKIALACMAETMMLAMEGRYENFTLGRDLTVEQVQEISRLAKKHGFKLAGFRSFERPLTLAEIEKIKYNARRKAGMKLHA
ncbi:saccharopine dehydrogenase NADP-binding domain-containing protein [Calderihabitans maritimus]|uniref:Shikimate/quinate 5-dehydrogenase n=1 Tax=Calderihabitans maritimus TaxID=1246530 RepID=A0A1Z5HTL5_9FIRM|nr:saccharopine dehydrogenase NADP-binding domain-containing protein [Calderihabitans maritimus]GAW92879.1 shikimate/quinate 5-dehydrogenase [Calderihabitans maritimus]